jgi:proteasome accessory factor C
MIRTAPKPKKSETALPLVKLLKLFQLIAILKSGRWTIKQLVDRFDSSKSSMYRYLELLAEAGFCLEKDAHDRYAIITTDDDPLQSQFTQEEMGMLRTLLQTDTHHPLTASVLKKLSFHSELDSMPRLFLKAHLGNLVAQLNTAMRSRHQVILKNYHSANSNEVRDRLVEPIHFGDNYSTIIALDTNEKICKQFKLDRISAIVETHTPFMHEQLHEQKNSDSFGFAGNTTAWITLHLSARAYLLLREEHPLALTYLKHENDTYIFHGPVAHYSGIGRFVLGLIDEIKIIAPEEFKEYVKGKVLGIEV